MGVATLGIVRSCLPLYNGRVLVSSMTHDAKQSGGGRKELAELGWSLTVSEPKKCFRLIFSHF